MNEKKRIWWIGGVGTLLFAVLTVLPLKKPSTLEMGPRLSTNGAHTPAEGRVHGNERRGTGFSAIETLLRRPTKKGAELPVSRAPNPTTEQCLDALTSSRVEADRVRAAMLLGQRAGEEGLAEKAVPALIASMENDDKSQVWLVSAQALGKYGAQAAEAVPSLMQWFNHVTMRNVAIDALGSIGAEAAPAIESIAQVAAHDQERIGSRRKAIEALVKIGGPDHPIVASLWEAAWADSDNRISIAIRQALKSQLDDVAPADGYARLESSNR